MPTVAGLGNVGPNYTGTRHNVGFEVVCELASRWELVWAAGSSAWTAHGGFAGKTVVLVQPHLYMNRSGEALARLNLVQDASDVIVVHDDIDLPCGSVRVKVGGGTAGHRGVASVGAQWGPEFTRVRVGVGRPAPGADVAAHVLGQFSSDEGRLMTKAVSVAADAVECILERGAAAAMLRFNSLSLELGLPERTAPRG